MSLENSIKDCISKELENGIIEKAIKQQLEHCISKSIEDVFGYSGEVRKTINNKLKEVMVPYLENYDYSASLTKLDYVLQEILKSESVSNKKLLENFKNLISDECCDGTIKISDLYAKWQEMIKMDINTSDIDDYNEYEGACLDVRMNCEEIEKPSWSSFENYIVTFECEKFEQYNIEFALDRWKSNPKKTCSLTVNFGQDLGTLRYLNSFQILLLKLAQSFSEIELDDTYSDDEIFIEGEYN